MFPIKTAREVEESEIEMSKLAGAGRRSGQENETFKLERNNWN
jgi:hypothetical protein